VPSVISGLDNLLADPGRYLKNAKRLGLVVNHTSVTADLRHSIVEFSRRKEFTVARLFAPEHGLYGVAQDMDPVAHGRDPVSGADVVSLYGEGEHTLTPDPALLNGLDALVFDIQDIGSRYYTFIYTMANCMQVCARAGLPLVVCDRPNPIGGEQVEGNIVGDAWRSFVGQYPLPNRHGMTAGELAQMFNEHFGIGCKLEVVPMHSWNRAQWFDATGLPWVSPSPNMPTLATATVYPGMCFIEGTELSEGRGTTLPFEQCGAPFIDPHALADRLTEDHLPGVVFRPQFFRPTFHKWAHQTCGGVQIHVTDRTRFKATLTGIAVVRAIAGMCPGQFQWRTKPYEFVSDRPAIDLLYGNADLRQHHIPQHRPLAEIEASWQADLEEFSRLRKQYLMY
jgi:uncharacterized protein YbbC (DUF1343 family)